MPKPHISWADFLTAAPYFTSLLYDALETDDDEIDISSLAPNYRAALYFDIFCGEVSNGGVTQYFYNQAFNLANFEKAPEYIAQNPVFAPILHLIQAAHAAWDDCRDDVIKAQKDDKWPEDLFNQYADKFEALETEFYAKYHQVSQQFCHALVLNPHDYFDITPIENVPEKGVAYVSLHNNTKHFRFKNGFPVGPNLFEMPDGFCQTITFDDARNTMQCSDELTQHFIHYPSLRSVRKRMRDGILETLRTDIAFWQHDGLYEFYHPTGQISSTDFYQQGESTGNYFYYPNGQISLMIEKQQNHQLFSRFWPNGQKNVQYSQDKNGGERYFWCFDEHGQDLAPNGSGKLLMIYDENVKKGRTWAEGILKNGKLVGELKRFE